MSDSYEPNNNEGLDDYLSSRSDVVTQGYVVGDGDDATAILPGSQTGNAAPSDQGFAAPVGVAPQRQVASPPPPPAQPAVSQEEYEEALQYAQQQEQLNRQLVRQQMELDEAIFESSLSHLDEYSKNYYRQQRYLEQFATANQGQAQRIQQLEQAQEYREQMEAKGQVALISMLRAGVNIGDREAKEDIMSAETRKDMDRRIGLWAKVHNMSNQQMAAQQTRAQVGAGAFAAAPQRGSNRGGSPKRDLMDYLGSTPYQYGDY